MSRGRCFPNVPLYVCDLKFIYRDYQLSNVSGSELLWNRKVGLLDCYLGY